MPKIHPRSKDYWFSCFKLLFLIPGNKELSLLPMRTPKSLCLLLLLSVSSQTSPSSMKLEREKYKSLSLSCLPTIGMQCFLYGRIQLRACPKIEQQRFEKDTNTNSQKEIFRLVADGRFWSFVSSWVQPTLFQRGPDTDLITITFEKEICFCCMHAANPRLYVVPWARESVF